MTARSPARHHRHDDACTALLFNGARLRIRPITPDDRAREADFLARLPAECRRFRFLGLVRQNGDAAAALTNVDPRREVSLIGLVGSDDGDEDGGEEIEVGVARFCASEDGTRCDCAVAVDPEWQDLGVGSALMQRLIAEARARGIRRMYTVDPVNCSGTHWLAEHLGFHRRIDPEDPQVVTFELDLAPRA